MSKIGIFSDPHVTKKLQGLESEWESSVIDTFEVMYKTFITEGVDYVVCAGDFFDKAVLEARHITLLNKLLMLMKGVKTYMLLGNHEIDTSEHNILDVFSVGSLDIIPVTKLTSISDVTFIPYNVPIESVDSSLIDNHIVFTHHDIYGSEIAGGKVKASFGVDPNIFNDSTITFNGHIHLRSKLGKVLNLGSLFSTQFGELKEGSADYPLYYIYDTESNEVITYKNYKSLYFVTINAEDPTQLYSYNSDNVRTVVRVLYDSKELISALPEDNSLMENALKIVYKKNIVPSQSVSTEIKRSETLDIKSLIKSYLNKDNTLTQESRDRIQEKSFNILGG